MPKSVDKVFPNQLEDYTFLAGLKHLQETAFLCRNIDMVLDLVSSDPELYTDFNSLICKIYIPRITHKSFVLSTYVACGS